MLVSSPNPSDYGQPVVLTGTITSSIGPAPDGEKVTFRRGTTVLGTGTLSGGTATFSTSSLGVGTKSLTALYAGDANFAASTSKSESQVINKASTTTTLVSSVNPSPLGQPVTFTATVTPEFGGIPTGIVSFTVTFSDGTATTQRDVALSGGVATFTTSKLTTRGTYTATANYKGNADFSSSSNSFTQIVD
jgi:hypothetical protein